MPFWGDGTGVGDTSPYPSQQGEVLVNQLVQQNQTPEDAALMLKNLAQTDPSYREMYISLLAERENQERAYQWYEDFNKNYYQRTSEDLKKAGLNPWLALQSLGSSGTGSIQKAGTFGNSGSTNASKQQEVNKQVGGKIAAGVLAAIGAIILALI